MKNPLQPSQNLSRRILIQNPWSKDSEGMILSAMLIVATFLSFIIFSILVLSSVNVQRSQTRIINTSAQYAAESAADAVIAQLNAGVTSPGTGGADQLLLDNSPYYKVYFNSTISGTGTQRIITGTGKTFAPSTATSPKITRQIRVTATQSTAGNVLAKIIATQGVQLTGATSFTSPEMYLGTRLRLQKSGSNNPWVKVGNLYVAGDDGSNNHCSINGNADGGSPGSGTETIRNYAIAPITNSNLYLSNTSCGGGQITIAPEVVKYENTSVPMPPAISLPWNNTMNPDNYTNPSQFPPLSFPGSGNMPPYNQSTLPLNYPCSSLGGTAAATFVPGHYPNNISGVLTSCNATSGSKVGSSGRVFIPENYFALTGDVHIRAGICSTTNQCNLRIKNGTNPQRPVAIYAEGGIYGNITQYVTDGGTPTAPIILITYSTATSSTCAFRGTVNANNFAVYAPNGDVCITGGTATMEGIGGKNVLLSGNAQITINPTPNGTFGGTSAWSVSVYQRL